MITQTFLALYWKETRQIFYFMVGFLVTLLLIAYFNNSFSGSINPADAKKRLAYVDLLLGSVLAFTILLGYLLSTGIRIVEQSQRLDSFLLTRPVPLPHLYGCLFVAGILNWLLWLGLSMFLLVWLNQPSMQFEEFLFDRWLLKALFYFLVIYIGTFSVGIIWPNLYATLVTSGLCIGLVTQALTQSRSSLPVILLLLGMAAALTLSWRAYQNQCRIRGWWHNRGVVPTGQNNMQERGEQKSLGGTRESH